MTAEDILGSLSKPDKAQEDVPETGEGMDEGTDASRARTRPVGDASGVGISRARRAVLAEYFTTDEGLLLFGVRADFAQPDVVSLPLEHEQLHRLVTTNFGAHNEVWQFLATGLEDTLWHEAYDYLIAPIVRWAAPGDIVYLVPHGLLHYLPLHALRLDGSYLAERNPVIYGPSASVLQF